VQAQDVGVHGGKVAGGARRDDSAYPRAGSELGSRRRP
jgi:hypothetical protein